MKIIIVGVGKVGYSLAANLCAEGHEVTVIDNNHRRLEALDEHLNVHTIEGNAARMDTLAQADIDEADLLIAVTEKDELNMVACFMAKSAGAKSTIARVRNPGYSDFDDTARLNALGIDMLINPEKVTAAEIAKLVAFPEANYVGYFGGGQLQILELNLDEHCHNLNKTLMEIDCPVPCIVVGIEREGKLLIPRGGDCLLPGDQVLLLAKTRDMHRVENYFNIKRMPSRDVIILGGNLSGYYLADMLEKKGRRLNVKIMEEDSERCRELAASLDHTLVINTENANNSLYEDENVGDCDVFVAITDDDKENLFAAVLAQSLGTQKIIVQIRGGEYAHVVERVGMDKVVSPSRLTTDAILSFINRNRILSLTRFDDSDGQLTEYRVPKTASCVGKSLMQLGFPKGAIICMLIRGQTHIIPQGSDTIEAGDIAIVFSLPESLESVEELFAPHGDG